MADRTIRTLPAFLRAQYPFESRFLDLDGHRLHYVDEGSGPAVLMVHGNPTWSFFYRDLIRELSATHRCIAVDHLGCGLSDKPADHTYNLASHIKSLQRLITSLNLESFDLVVHDWGGPIGLGAVMEELHRVNSVVIMNTAAFRSPWVPLRIRLCRAPMIGTLLVRGLNGFCGPAIHMAVNRRPLSYDARRGFLFPYRSWADRVAIRAFIEDIPDRERHPSHPLLTRIEESLTDLNQSKVLLAWGGADFCFHHGFLAQWQEILPDARTFLVPDAGHYLLEDAGAEIIPEIKSFLRQTQ
ncbi:MAG: alpha/beta hydrolase [Verrucomicrobia bacterium]|nr:MAG: alpha/beta hydrolase [Verrucomicrobiota bacterium]